MSKNILTPILIICGIVLIIFIGKMVYSIYSIGSFNKDYSVTDLKNNFNEKRNEINDLKMYFNGIVPKNRFVEIEFDNDSTLTRLGIEALDTTAGDPYGPMFLEWDLKLNTQLMDSILKPMGWTNEILKTLKQKLENANCIQIESGEPSKIGFKRSGMKMYSFIVFENPIADSLKSQYNDGCTYILVDNKLALKYDGGAIGNQCFQDK